MKKQTTNHDASEIRSSNTICIGHRLFCDPKSRSTHYARTEYTVSKIGKKYFYVKENDRLKFDKETLQHIDSDFRQNNIQLYRTEQEIQDIKERKRLYDTVREYFSYDRGKSLSTLREIVAIIEHS